MRRIVSVVLPLWPIERLRRNTPDDVPADRPLALVESGAHGLRITALNRLAAGEGVRIGTALADARAILPALLSRPAEPARDRAALLKLARWSGRYGPARHIDGEDGLWIDISGVAHLFGGEDHLLADLAGRLAGFGVTARTGLAGTLGAAHALARFATRSNVSPATPLPLGRGRRGLDRREKHPDTDPRRVRGLATESEPAANPLTLILSPRGEGLHWHRNEREGTHCFIAPPGAERAVLAALPVEALRLAPETVLLLKRLGLRHIGQLYDLPRAALERRFRSENSSKSKAREHATMAGAVLTRLDQALGLRDEPRRPLGEPPLLEARRTWSEPLISSDAIDAETSAMAEDLCEMLKARALGANRIRLSLWRTDGSVAEVAAGFSSANRNPLHLMRLLTEKLAAIDAGFGIDAAVLAVLSAERLGAEQTALDANAGMTGEEGTAALVDCLVNRLGGACVTCLAPRASHIPERAEVRVAARFPSPHRSSRWGEGHGGAVPPARGEGQPQTMSPASAPHPNPLPVRTGRGDSALRPPFLLPAPEPISVMAEVPEGPPARFSWRRVLYRVVKADGPERIAPEWWRAIGINPSTSSKARPRDYYRLEDSGGARFWVFREGLYQHAADEGAPRWFLHGLFG